MIKAVLCDIEGTTTDIDFVHKVLFPYSRKHLRSFLEKNEKSSEVQEVLFNLKKNFLMVNRLLMRL